jgi:hypothetical protein
VGRLRFPFHLRTCRGIPSVLRTPSPCVVLCRPVLCGTVEWKAAKERGHPLYQTAARSIGKAPPGVDVTLATPEFGRKGDFTKASVARSGLELALLR